MVCPSGNIVHIYNKFSVQIYNPTKVGIMLMINDQL